MKNHYFGELIVSLFSLVLVVFLALAISTPPASAGMGFMKRGDDARSDRGNRSDDNGKNEQRARDDSARQERERQQGDRDRQERDRQDRDRQAQMERDRQGQAERDRQARDERDRQDRDRQAQMERDRQQGDRDRQARDERDRQDRDRQAQMERDRQADRDRQARAEHERQAGVERDRQARADRDRQERDRQAQADRDRQAERDRQAREESGRQERDRQAQIERDRQAEHERQARVDRDRQERDRQGQVERDRQSERERQARVDRDRQDQQARAEHERRQEVDRQAQVERERQTERDRQAQTERDRRDRVVRSDDRNSDSGSRRSGLGGAFDNKRGDGDRNGSVRESPRGPVSVGSGPARTGETYSGRTSTRPQRTNQTTRPSSWTSGTWNGRGGVRTGERHDRVFTRVYETRRDWRVRYHSYNYNHRPRYNGGFYYYGSNNYDPYNYGFYCFSYLPSRTYPSLYFHYGTFPYLYRTRLFFLSFPVRHYVYVPIYLDDDDYYLRYNRYEPYPGYYFDSSSRTDLRDTLGDIREAWERGDMDLLMRHVRYSERVHIYFKSKYSYSVDYDDYRDMTRDAMETLDTVSFRFDDVKFRYRDEVVAYGTHTYYDSDDEYSEVKVTYTLERRGGQWYITEVGSSPRYKISRY